MKQDQISGSEDLNRMIDLFQGAHPGRQKDRFPLGTCVPQEVVVGQRGGCDLIARGIEAVDEVH